MKFKLNYAFDLITVKPEILVTLIFGGQKSTDWWYFNLVIFSFENVVQSTLLITIPLITNSIQIPSYYTEQIKKCLRTL